MSARLRIVQILAGPYPTRQGSQVYVRGMAHALARLGHEVTVACYGHADGPSSCFDGPLRVVRTPRVPGYASLRAGPDVVKPILDVALLASLLRLAPEADIFHAHNYEAPVAALLPARLHGVPLVYNAHNTMAEELPTYFGGAFARRLAGIAGRLLDARVPSSADAAIAISVSGLERLRGLGCCRLHHVPPGVDIAELERADPARARRRYELDGRLWVIYAGNPDTYQDLDVLVEAMTLASSIGLLMVSASPLEPWRARLSGAGVDPARVRLVVTNSWPETRDLMAAADMAALPRAVCSGFPIKLLNYLGLGLPSVVARGSAVDIPGVLVVPNHDARAFAEALESLAADASWRQDLGERARREVHRSWSWDARALELEAVYEDLLSAPPSPSVTRSAR